MPPSFQPLVLSPALPSELIRYVVHCHVYPTTLIICGPKADFLDALAHDVHQQSAPGTPEGAAGEAESRPGQSSLLTAPLDQVAVSRHIRTVYVPTVTHLHAYLAVFTPEQSKVAPPPESFNPTTHKPPRLILYGAIELHRDTSEWSAQGLNQTAAAIVDTAHRLGWRVAMIEPQRQGPGDALGALLKERLPVISGGTRRSGFDSDEAAWTSRTIEVGRILSRWFDFRRGPWDVT